MDEERHQAIKNLDKAIKEVTEQGKKETDSKSLRTLLGGAMAVIITGSGSLLNHAPG
jgi:hypothetical protein